MAVNVLQAEGIGYMAGGVSILRDLNVSLEAGELVGFIGPNGAGKSTLLKILCGLLPAASGQVLLEGQPLAASNARQRARNIGYLPQGARAQWPVSVERVVALGRLPYQSWWSSGDRVDREKIDRAMRLAEVEAYRNRVVTTLSGGEQTLVMLARIFATEPQVIFADEPVAALDPYHQLHVMELLREHSRDQRCGIVVLHDLSLAARFCDRIYLLRHGELFCSGTPDQVMTNQHFAEVYGIEADLHYSEGVVSIVPGKRICSGHP